MIARRDYGASCFNAPGTFMGIGFSPDSRALEALVAGRGASRWLTFAVDTGAVTARRDLEGEWRDLRVLPDGGLLVSDWGKIHRLSADAATVWKIEDEEEHALRLAAVSPDGALLVTTTRTGAEVRDGARGELVRALKEPDGELHAVAFSRDGRWLATGAAKGTVRLYDAHSGEELCKRKSTKVLALAFSPAGDRLLVGHGNGKVELWDLPGLKPVPRFRGYHQFDAGGAAGCRWVGVSADGKRGFSLGNEGRLRAWNLPGGGQTFALDVPRRHAQGSFTAMSQDGRWLATSSTTGALSVWSAATGEPRVHDAAPAPILGLALTQETVVAASNGSWVAWDRATGSSTALPVTFPPSDVFGLSSDQFVRLDYDKIFVGLDADEPSSFELETYASGPLALSRDEALLAVPAQDNVEVWDLQRSTRLASLPHAERTQACAFGPRDAWLVTADDVLHLWRWAPTPTSLRDIPLAGGRGDVVVRGLAVSARGYIAVSLDTSVNHYDADSAILLVDPRDGTTVARLARPGVRLGQVAFVGTRLAVADSAGRLLLVDVSDPADPRWFEQSNDDVFPARELEELPLAVRGADVAHVGPGGDIVVHTLDAAQPELGEPFLLAPEPATTPPSTAPPTMFERRLAGARFLFAGRFKTAGPQLREATIKELGGEIASKPDARVTHLALGDKPSQTVLDTLKAKGAEFIKLHEAALMQLLLPTPDEARALLRGELADAAERWNTWRRRYIELGGEVFPTRIHGIDLAGLDLRAYSLKVLDFTGADLAGADLRGVDLFDTVFRNADLRGVDFTGGRCYRTVFSGARLNGARLGVELASARFDGAILTDADLRDASLQYADFSGADLRGALLPKALPDVKHDARTRWPDGVRPK